MKLQHDGILNDLKLIKRKHWRKYKKEVMVVVYGAVIYKIWATRNQRMYKRTIACVLCLFPQIQATIRISVKLYSEAKIATIGV